jgi:hypothetical protein
LELKYTFAPSTVYEHGNRKTHTVCEHEIKTKNKKYET